MKTILALLAVLGAASPSYFKYQRRLDSANASSHHYLIVDEILWRHARPDMGDLRLYSADREIPYALSTEHGSLETLQKSVPLLQPGSVGGKTQFLLDMSGIAEYNRIELKLATRNFVAHALVEGQDDPHGKQWA